MEDKSHDIIWNINLELGTRALVSYMKLHCSFESVGWKNFIIFNLQLKIAVLILAYYLLENMVWNCYLYLHGWF